MTFDMESIPHTYAGTCSTHSQNRVPDVRAIPCIRPDIVTSMVKGRNCSRFFQQLKIVDSRAGNWGLISCRWSGRGTIDRALLLTTITPSADQPNYLSSILLRDFLSRIACACGKGKLRKHLYISIAIFRKLKMMLFYDLVSYYSQIVGQNLLTLQYSIHFWIEEGFYNFLKLILKRTSFVIGAL